MTEEKVREYILHWGCPELAVAVTLSDQGALCRPDRALSGEEAVVMLKTWCWYYNRTEILSDEKQVADWIQVLMKELPR